MGEGPCKGTKGWTFYNESVFFSSLVTSLVSTEKR